MDSLGSKHPKAGRISASTVELGESADSASSVEMYCPSCDRAYPNGDSCPDDGTLLVRIESSADPLIGRVIDDRFEIKELIGAGGMGSVYAAWQASVGREVAIKVIKPGSSDSTAAAKRFLREAKLSSRLSQPNTVAVYDFGRTEGTDGGLLYLVMERLVGQTLREVMKQSPSFSVARALRVGIQLCDALDAANQLNIVHRDLKPSNILILDDPPGRDSLKVLDFGLAKVVHGDDTHTTVTATGAVLGTPTYMPPEAISGETVDHRSDLYSLGVILYELLAGRPPFRAGVTHALYAMHLEAQPEPLDSSVPAAVAEVVERLLSKRPEDRIQSAAAVRDLLVALRTQDESGALRGRAPASRVKGDAAAHADTVIGDLALATRTATQGRGRLVAGMVALALAAAALVFWISSDSAGENSSASALGQAQADQPTPEGKGEGHAEDRLGAVPSVELAARDASPQRPPVPAKASFQFESEPSARVSIAGRVVGTTPFDHAFPISDAPITLSFEAEGFETQERSITPNASDSLQVLSVKLKASRTGAKRSERKRSSRRSGRRGKKPSPRARTDKKPSATDSAGNEPAGDKKPAEDELEIPFILPSD